MKYFKLPSAGWLKKRKDKTDLEDLFAMPVNEPEKAARSPYRQNPPEQTEMRTSEKLKHHPASLNAGSSAADQQTAEQSPVLRQINSLPASSAAETDPNTVETAPDAVMKTADYNDDAISHTGEPAGDVKKIHEEKITGISSENLIGESNGEIIKNDDFSENLSAADQYGSRSSGIIQNVSGTYRSEANSGTFWQRVKTQLSAVSSRISNRHISSAVKTSPSVPNSRQTASDSAANFSSNSRNGRNTGAAEIAQIDHAPQKIFSTAAVKENSSLGKAEVQNISHRSENISGSAEFSREAAEPYRQETSEIIRYPENNLKNMGNKMIQPPVEEAAENLTFFSRSRPSHSTVQEQQLSSSNASIPRMTEYEDRNSSSLFSAVYETAPGEVSEQSTIVSGSTKWNDTVQNISTAVQDVPDHSRDPMTFKPQETNKADHQAIITQIPFIAAAGAKIRNLIPSKISGTKHFRNESQKTADVFSAADQLPMTASAAISSGDQHLQTEKNGSQTLLTVQKRNNSALTGPTGWNDSSGVPGILSKIAECSQKQLRFLRRTHELLKTSGSEKYYS